MSKVITIQANVRWRAERGENPERWVGFCDELGITTEAGSLDELHSLIPEAISILLADLLEDNELDTFLSVKGWEYSEKTDMRASHPSEVHIPWHLIYEAQNDPKRAFA